MAAAPRSVVFVFVTFEGTAIGGNIYDYQDDMAVGSKHLIFSAQNKWVTNDRLLTAEGDIYVFCRQKKTHPFYYAGKVTEKSVHTKRTRDTPLKMSFVLDPKNHDIAFPNQVFIVPREKGIGKYKRAVYKALNATPLVGDGIAVGIVPVSVPINP